MKKSTILLCLLIALTWKLTAQQDTSLEFSQLPFEDFLKKAKNENKPMMLYFHFRGCGGCVQLEKNTFKDSSCIGFMKRNYLSYSINTKEPEGMKINALYKVRIHPTLLFLSPDSQQVHQLVGFFPPQEFREHAKNALTKENNLSSMDLLYQSGNRNPDFLLKYCYLLRDAYKLDSTRINDYLETQTDEDLKSETNRRFIYEFCVHHYKISTPYGTRAFNSFHSNRHLYYALFDSEQVDTRLAWIMSAQSNQVILSDNKEAFSGFLKDWKPLETSYDRKFVESNGNTTGIMFSAYLGLKWELIYAVKHGDKSSIQLQKYKLKNALWNDHEKLNQYAWAQVESESEPEILSLALELSERSLELNPCYAYTDTKAWLLYLTGRKKEALKLANKAMKSANEKKEDASSTQKLIDQIKQNTSLNK